MYVCLPHPGAGILSQSALQLNNQEGAFPYTAGYHSSQTLALGDPATSQPLARGAQVGGAVHSYNQVGFGYYSLWKSNTTILVYTLGHGTRCSFGLPLCRVPFFFSFSFFILIKSIQTVTIYHSASEFIWILTGLPFNVITLLFGQSTLDLDLKFASVDLNKTCNEFSTR